MADVTLTSFPAGAAVSLYPASNWPASTNFPSGAPVGSAAAGPTTVPASGTVTFSGLNNGGRYFAHATVDSQERYVQVVASARDASHRTLKRAQINASTLGNNTIVAAVSGKRICVYDYSFVSTSANTARFYSGTPTTTPLTGAMAFAANGGIQDGTPDAEEPLFETNAGEALTLTLSAAAVVGGYLTYAEE